jgi:Coenzyme PQQ synthesis protein D (PqqD)
MEANSRFTVNSPQVTHETIDGEAVILNLDTGSYYSVNNAAAVIWNLLDSGMSIGRIVETVSAKYTGEPKEIEAGVNALIEKLAEEGLIIANGELDGTAIEPTGATEILNGETLPFEFPKLHKYTDMEDLLLLDPIHDVDDIGWPNKPRDEK